MVIQQNAKGNLRCQKLATNREDVYEGGGQLENLR